MSRKQYYGYIDNGASYNRVPYIDTNKARLQVLLVKIAKGNNYGNGCNYTIYDNNYKRIVYGFVK